MENLKSKIPHLELIQNPPAEPRYLPHYVLKADGKTILEAEVSYSNEGKYYYMKLRQEEIPDDENSNEKIPRYPRQTQYSTRLNELAHSALRDIAAVLTNLFKEPVTFEDKTDLAKRGSFH